VLTLQGNYHLLIEHPEGLQHLSEHLAPVFLVRIAKDTRLLCSQENQYREITLAEMKVGQRVQIHLHGEVYVMLSRPPQIDTDQLILLPANS
jgi:hypothetical protein